MLDLVKSLKSRQNNWAGPLSNLLVRDFKNTSSFEILGSFHPVDFHSGSASDVNRKYSGNENMKPKKLMNFSKILEIWQPKIFPRELTNILK